MRKLIKICVVVFWAMLLISCEKESSINYEISDYTGTYKNLNYTENVIGNFKTGIYPEDSIPNELKKLEYGRIEIEFTYKGGALESFMPILYFGSINKNDEDNLREETREHLVVEIGHYNVVPFPLENLFYTICYDRYPLYCRDTYAPVIAGQAYTFLIDKRPEGVIIQLRIGDEIVNSFPSAFFPDSSQLFFNHVTQKVEKERGDSLELVMMVGKGFVGFAEGLHDFNGKVSNIKITAYNLQDELSNYDLLNIKNQHYVHQQINYMIRDNKYDSNAVRFTFDFQPYNFENGRMVPFGEPEQFETSTVFNNEPLTFNINHENIGLFKINLETIDKNNKVINKTNKPFDIWVYPKEWAFNY